MFHRPCALVPSVQNCVIGRAKRRSNRFPSLKGVTRTILACMHRTVGGRAASSVRPVEGISTEIEEERRMYRRAARRAPPSLMLRIVPNSRNSFPCWSTPRTKAGIANGSRCQRRRWRFRSRLGTRTPVPRVPSRHDVPGPLIRWMLLGAAK